MYSRCILFNLCPGGNIELEELLVPTYKIKDWTLFGGWGKSQAGRSKVQDYYLLRILFNLTKDKVIRNRQYRNMFFQTSSRKNCALRKYLSK